MGVMGELQAEVQPILEIVQDQGRVSELRQEKLFTQAYLQQLSITPAHVDVLHRYAKFIFDCGDYALASNLLLHFRLEPILQVIVMLYLNFLSHL